MARHTTPKTLNDNLRLGRLTLPQWVAVAVGGVSLWLWATVAASIRDINGHVLVATVPTILTAAPILAFFRGGIERYPQQVMRYAVRRGLVYSVRGLVLVHMYGQKGLAYAAASVREWQGGRRRRA